MSDKKEKIILEFDSKDEVNELFKVVNLASKSIGIDNITIQGNCLHFATKLTKIYNGKDNN